MQNRRTMINAPFFYQQIGRWWGSDPVRKRAEEIDICAMNQAYLLIGECKWTTKEVSMQVLQDLIEHGTLFNQKNKFYYLFSKSGFHESVLEYAAIHDECRLITLNDFYDNKYKKR